MSDLSGPFQGGMDGAVRAVLHGEQRTFTVTELVERTGLPERSVRRALGKLVAAREAKKAGGDRFTAPAMHKRKHPPTA